MHRRGTVPSRRQFLRAAAGAAAGASLLSAGCDHEPPLPPGAIAINFYTYASPEFRTLFHKQLVPGFERMHPNIRIRVNESMGDAGYDAKLLTLIAGKLSPDLFHVTQQNFPFYAAKNMLLPLDNFLAADESMSGDEFYPQLTEAMRRDGRLLGLPSDFSPIVMLYNQDMFDRYGLPYPRPGWTTDDFLHACKVLTRDLDGDGYTDVFGFCTPNAYNRWPAWVWMNGGRIFSEDGTRCVMDEAAAVEGLKFYVDLSLRHGVAPTPDQAMGQEQANLFASQMVGMIAESRYIYKRLIGARNLPFRWDVAPMPRAKAQATTFIWGGNCILRSTKHPREAWEFLKFMSGPAGAAINLEAGNALPAYRQAAEEAVLNPTDPRTPAGDRYFLEAVSYGQTAPNPPQYAEYVQAMSVFQDAFLNLRSVEEACRIFTDEVNEVLASEVFT